MGKALLISERWTVLEILLTGLEILLTRLEKMLHIKRGVVSFVILRTLKIIRYLGLAITKQIISSKNMRYINSHDFRRLVTGSPKIFAIKTLPFMRNLFHRRLLYEQS